MIKKIKGLVVQDKDNNIKVLTSVFAGSTADVNIKNNIIKGLENFGFTKQAPGKKSNPDYENYSVEIDGNNAEEVKLLKSIIDSKKRHDIYIAVNDGKTLIVKTVSIPSSDEDKIKETEIIESKNEVKKYIGFATYNSENKNGSSIGLIFSAKNDDEEKINEYLSLGLGRMEQKEGDEWCSFSTWLNKPSEEEIEIMKEFPSEEGKYKKRGIITLDTTSYGDIKIINGIISIEDIPEKVETAEAEENAPF